MATYKKSYAKKKKLPFSLARMVLYAVIALVAGGGAIHFGKGSKVTATHDGIVTRVADGDTVLIKKDNNESLRIRLFGVDAPESAQKGGKESASFTASLVLNQDVLIHAVSTDQYGRTLAIITLPDGRSLNEELVKNGHAWVYRNYCDQAICTEWSKLERAAKEAERGLWAAKNPQAPWNWRKQHPRN